MSLESRLARTYDLGTWLASAIIAAGLAAGVPRLVECGIVCLLGLPTLGLAIMGVSFARAGERRAAVLAAVVIAVLGLGLLLG